MNRFSPSHPFSIAIRYSASRAALACFFAILSLLSTIPNVAFATRFYVDQAIGSDDNEGITRQEPWKTITHAATTSQSGDLVVVFDGDYTEDFDDNTGQPAGVAAIFGRDSIRFVAAGGCSPVVRGFFVLGSTNVEIRGFTVQGPMFCDLVPNWQDMPCIVRNDQQGDLEFFDDEGSIALPPREDVEAAFPDYFSLVDQLNEGASSDQSKTFPSIGINLENCHNARVRNNYVDGYWAGIQTRGCSRALIWNNVVSHCANGIYATSSDDTPALVDSRIMRNEVTQCLDNGIDIRDSSSNVRISSNSVSCSGIGHISLSRGVSGCTIANNTVQFGGFYSETMNAPGSSAISVNGALQGNRIFRNSISEQIDLTFIDGNGIILDLMLEGASVLVSRNVCSRNMGSGLNTTISPNAKIYYNLFLENGFGSRTPRNGAGIKLSRDEDVNQTIYGNLFAFNREAGIITNDNINDQKRIDRNGYISIFAPLIWDGFERGQREYRSIRQIRIETGWEHRGWAFGPLF